MQENDKLKFAEIMTGIGELYNKTISKPFLSIFFEALKEHDIESVVLAISAHVRNAENGQFFPKPADIISTDLRDTVYNILGLHEFTVRYQIVAEPHHMVRCAFKPQL